MQLLQKLAGLLLLAPTLLLGQYGPQPPATPAGDRVKSYQSRGDMLNMSLGQGIPFNSIGPTIMSGRVVDLDVWDQDPSHFYVAYASGGLWKTENNGTSFTPLFDREMVMTIGDIAVDWKRNTIWVGTGEVNSSRSSYAGIGVYKSTNGGKTWQYLGLPESHHIGRIVLHPTDPNTAWVAALGHLYSPNPERGVYKTSDGGKTWQHVLKIDENTGAVDLVIDPGNPNSLYAATWSRTRRSWDFQEAGAGSGIYHSTNGGKNWQLLSGPKSGFPNGEGAGRIGLDIAKVGKQTVLFAAIDNYFQQDKKEEPATADELTKNQLRTMSKADFLTQKKYLIKDYLQSNGFPAEYTVDKVIDMVKSDKITPLTLVEFTEDANSLLFDRPIVGLEIYRSDDNGRSWRRTHDAGFLDNVHFTYGYYFAQVRVAPNDPQRVYTMGVPVLRSNDGGKTWKSINGDNVHSDHHALWVNPKRPGHIILGNDGGVNISYDDGENWIKCNTPAVGQFYAVAVDMAEPYNVYGGLQDNGVWMGPKNSRINTNWHDSGEYPFKAIGGGDGMQVTVDTRDNTTVVTGLQFGNYFRVNTQTGARKFITPKHKLGERPLRWNWQTPVQFSTHNMDILYMCSNKVHRSFDQGDTFTEISGDLTKGGRKGDVPYGTIATFHESPRQFGLLYVGSDDGLIHVSRDAGYSWQLISGSLPQDMWVSRVQASAHVDGRVYASLNGYRWDDFTPYLYVSEDYGKTWTQLGKDLPLEPINVVREDPSNPDLLYVGTDHGLYASLDRGKSFQLLGKDLPGVAVHDLVIHPRDHEILVGTHGRSLYIAPVKEWQQLNAEVLAQTIKAFEPDALRSSPRWGAQGAPWQTVQEPSATLPIYVKSGGTVKVEVKTDDGKTTLQSFDVAAVKGLNYLACRLDYDSQYASMLAEKLNKNLKEDDKPITLKAADNGKFYLPKGKYKITLTKDGASAETTLTLR